MNLFEKIAEDNNEDKHFLQLVSLTGVGMGLGAMGNSGIKNAKEGIEKVKSLKSKIEGFYEKTQNELDDMLEKKIKKYRAHPETSKFAKFNDIGFYVGVKKDRLNDAINFLENNGEDVKPIKERVQGLPFLKNRILDVTSLIDNRKELLNKYKFIRNGGLAAAGLGAAGLAYNHFKNN